MKINLGIAPIAWSNDDMPELGGDTPIEQCLEEAKMAGFSGIELAIVIAVLSIFSAVAIPAFNCVRRRAISTAAQETIRQIKEECETNYIYGIDKFTSSNPDKYQISATGSNSCSGGTVTLTPEDTNLYPTYFSNSAEVGFCSGYKTSGNAISMGSPLTRLFAQRTASIRPLGSF